MKKPVLIKTTAQVIPIKESETTTFTQINIAGRIITDPLSYSPPKGKEYLSNQIFKKDFDPYQSGVETLGKQARPLKQNF